MRARLRGLRSWLSRHGTRIAFVLLAVAAAFALYLESGTRSAVGDVQQRQEKTCSNGVLAKCEILLPRLAQACEANPVQCRRSTAKIEVILRAGPTR